jgi:Flp pilus assembly protein TadD
MMANMAQGKGSSSRMFDRFGARNLLGCVLLLSFVVYGRGVFNEFVFDDHMQIEQNPYVYSAHFLKEIFTTNVFSFRGAEGISNYYRPAMTLGFLLCNKVFHGSPLGFHLVSLILNCLIVALVFFVTRSIFDDLFTALIAATVFGLHPIHTEAVYWISAVTELELAVFLLLAFLFYLELDKANAQQRFWLQAGMIGSFALALLSKEQALLFPLLVTAYEHLYRPAASETSFATKLQRYAGFWAAVAVYVPLRIHLLGAFAPMRAQPGITTGQVILTAFALFGDYIRKLIWPFPLVAYYPLQKSVSIGEPRVLAGIAVALALLVLFVVLWRRRRIYSFALLWICIPLLPVLNVRVLTASFFNERYLYLPSVGYSWLAAGAFVFVWRSYAPQARAPRWALGALAVALLVACSVSIWMRGALWRNERSFITETLAVRPDAYYLRTNYGALEWSSGDRDLAIREWKQAVAQKPNNSIALTQLGQAMAQERQFDQAFAYLTRAVEVNPLHSAAYVARGQIYAALGNAQSAGVDLSHAVQLAPLSVTAQNALGEFLLSHDRFGDARRAFEASLYAIETADGFEGLAECVALTQGLDRAEGLWRRVLELSPGDPRPHGGLGKLYLERGDFTNAEKEYRAVLAANPNDSIALAALRQIDTRKGTPTR